METKEEKRQKEKKGENFIKQVSTRPELDENLEVLGFNQKKASREEKKVEQRGGKGKKDKKDKVVINDDDFPSL